MSSHSERPLFSTNGHADGNGKTNGQRNSRVNQGAAKKTSQIQQKLEHLDKQLASLSTTELPTGFHGDTLIGVSILSNMPVAWRIMK